MIRLECDYTEGAHPRILERLSMENLAQNPGYGEDPHCRRAAELIRASCGRSDVQIRFLVGGTQTNATVIAACLRPHEGVVSADAGHIAVHETGAVESYGHKVLSQPTQDGKLTAAQVESVCAAHDSDPTRAHQVRPGMVYLSFPTENGLLYTKSELKAIHDVCLRRGIPLYVDGARLGYGLMSPKCDITFSEFAGLCDVFTIGGTKVGALFGEAVVNCGAFHQEEFQYLIKQHGALLAKGWLLGIQFETLFEDGLYWEMGQHAVSLAFRIRNALEVLGVPMLCDSPTNQQFVLFKPDALHELERNFAFCPWGPCEGGRIPVRICTSWATREEDVDSLISRLNDVKDLL